MPVSTVLVIDDEPYLLELIGRMLRGSGYVVLTALNGPEGLAIFRHTQVDAVITDLIMHPMSGYELVEAIKDDLDGRGVVFVTGASDANPVVGQAAEVAGSLNAAILAKPFTRRELLSTLENLLAPTGPAS